MVEMSYTAYRGQDSIIKPSSASVPTLGSKDILVKITHSGLCASDTAYIPYGAALGHEGVGIVEAIGSDVTRFKIGDHAGGGYLRDSCGHCSYCLKSEEIWCYERIIFGEKDYSNGTIAEYYIGKETYLHRIPEKLPSDAAAADLQCAGATVYSATSVCDQPRQQGRHAWDWRPRASGNVVCVQVGRRGGGLQLEQRQGG